MQPAFTIERPRSVEEAVELLSARDDLVRPLAGGTGLTLLMKYGFFEPEILVDLRRMHDELAGVEPLTEGGLRIGAMTTLREMERDRRLQEQYPLFGEALGRLASVRVRNVAQLGGAVAHGHPQMDIPPVLLATEAAVTVVSAGRETRTIPADQLFLGYYETAVEPGELITEVKLPVVPPAARSTYRKVTARTIDDWPALGIAVVGALEDDEVAHLRVAVGALGDRPQRLPAVEEALMGERVDGAVLREVAQEAADSLELHDNTAGSVGYQRHLIAVHLRRALDSTLLDARPDAGGR